MERGVAEESDGAKCVFVEGAQIPLIVQKTDGGFGYASTDMAAGGGGAAAAAYAQALLVLVLPLPPPPPAPMT